MRMLQRAILLLCSMVLLTAFQAKKVFETLKKNDSETLNLQESEPSDIQDVEKNTEFEVGEKCFYIDIPEFNVLSEGDIADADGNTWLILQSDVYENLEIQLSVHNLKSEKKPASYSLEELGIVIKETQEVSIHGFKKEQISIIEKNSGEVYTFETADVSGELCFLSLSETGLSQKEKEYFDTMVRSIEIKNKE